MVAGKSITPTFYLRIYHEGHCLTTSLINDGVSETLLEKFVVDAFYLYLNDFGLRLIKAGFILNEINIME